MERKEITKEFTKEQAINLHRSMWLWIAKQIARYKNPMEIGDLKQSYIRCQTDFTLVSCDCFACDYAYQEKEEKYGYESYHCRCEFCPLEWGTCGDEDGNYMCEENVINNKQGLGLYAKCKDVWNKSFIIGSKKDLYKRQVKLAYKIAMLPEKE